MIKFYFSRPRHQFLIEQVISGKRNHKSNNNTNEREQFIDTSRSIREMNLTIVNACKGIIPRIHSCCNFVMAAIINGATEVTITKRTTTITTNTINTTTILIRYSDSI